MKDLKPCPFCGGIKCNCKPVETVWDNRLNSCGYCYNFDCALTSECHKNIIIAAEQRESALRATLTTREAQLREMCAEIISLPIGGPLARQARAILKELER